MADNSTHDLLEEYPIGTLSPDQRAQMEQITAQDPTARVYEYRYRKELPESERTPAADVHAIYLAIQAKAHGHPLYQNYTPTGWACYLWDYHQKELDNISTQIGNLLVKENPQFRSFRSTHEKFFEKAIDILPKPLIFTQEVQANLRKWNWSKADIVELRKYNQQKFLRALEMYQKQNKTTETLINLSKQAQQPSKAQVQELLMEQFRHKEKPDEYYARLNKEAGLVKKWETKLGPHINTSAAVPISTTADEERKNETDEEEIVAAQAYDYCWAN